MRISRKCISFVLSACYNISFLFLFQCISYEMCCNQFWWSLAVHSSREQEQTGQIENLAHLNSHRHLQRYCTLFWYSLSPWYISKQYVRPRLFSRGYLWLGELEIADKNAARTWGELIGHEIEGGIFTFYSDSRVDSPCNVVAEVPWKLLSQELPLV